MKLNKKYRKTYSSWKDVLQNCTKCSTKKFKYWTKSRSGVEQTPVKMKKNNEEEKKKVAPKYNFTILIYVRPEYKL